MNALDGGWGGSRGVAGHASRLTNHAGGLTNHARRLSETSGKSAGAGAAGHHRTLQHPGIYGR